MSRAAALGDIILVADSAGDRPAIVTKVFTATSVEACLFAPLPEFVKVANIYVDRTQAIGATLRDSGHHAYWKS